MLVFSSSTLYDVDDKTSNEINTSMQTFLRKYQALNRDEVTAALMVNFDDITDTLSKEILCVGCRRSVEGKATIVLVFYPLAHLGFIREDGTS